MNRLLTVQNEAVILPPEEASPPTPEDRLVVLAGIHPDELVHEIPVYTGLASRYPVVAAHPEAARKLQRHLGPDEMMRKRFKKPEPGMIWTPEEVAAQALKTYLGANLSDPTKVIIGPHSNEIGVEFAEIGLISSHRAVVLAGLAGMRHVLVSDSSYYTAIANGLTLEYASMEDAIDCMTEGGVFDNFSSMDNAALADCYDTLCDEQLTFYQVTDINAATCDAQPVQGKQWEALKELEQMTVAGNFSSLPANLPAELLAPFGITACREPAVSICWGYNNNSQVIEQLETFNDPVTDKPTQRKFCFAQIAVPIAPPQPLQPNSRSLGWIWFPELHEAL